MIGLPLTQMSLYDQVLDFIERQDSEGFEPLALEVFRFQYHRINVYRRFCDSFNINPITVTHVEQIPPISTAGFKFADVKSADESIERVFVTSGTSRGTDRRGRHFLPQLCVYRASALAHMRRMLFPEGLRTGILLLHPTSEKMSDSSLAQMLSWMTQEFGSQWHCCAATPHAIDAGQAVDFMQKAQRKGRPICLAGTTAAFSSLFEALFSQNLKFSLAAGSRLMDTGGPKGQGRPLASDELIGLAGRLLGIPPEMAINEYGMTELCSQLYDATKLNCSGADEQVRFKLAPPWMRVTAVDPVTLAPLRSGEVGMLQFFDLANVGSVSALLTEDLGRVKDGRVWLMGRLDASEPRGCALGIEQFAGFEKGASEWRPVRHHG